MNSRNHRYRRGFGYLDLIVMLVLLPLVAVVLAGCLRRYGHGDNRVKCASNLRQIGQALLLYSNENKKAYPRTSYVAGPTVTPVWGTGTTAKDPFGPGGPQANDVSAALFLLIRTQDIGSEVFTCPSADSAKDDFGGKGNTAANRSNFTDLKKNLSYSFANPYPDDAARKAGYKLNNELGPDFAVAADLNPGVKPAGKDDVLAVTSSSSTTKMKMGNSNNHDKDGQNVLYGDGHVEFVNNPFMGTARDNIYANGNKQVVASPVDANDSVLLPTDD